MNNVVKDPQYVPCRMCEEHGYIAFELFGMQSRTPHFHSKRQGLHYRASLVRLCIITSDQGATLRRQIMSSNIVRDPEDKNLHDFLNWVHRKAPRKPKICDVEQPFGAPDFSYFGMKLVVPADLEPV